MRSRLLISFLLLFLVRLCAQPVTIGLLSHAEGNQPGTVLFAPIANLKTYLVDKCGYMLHSWTSVYRPGVSVYFLEDGTLLRTGNTVNPIFSAGGGGGGAIEKLDWNSNVLWSYIISDSSEAQHHDILPLPNGNILALTWQHKTRAEAIAAGRDSTYLATGFWNERIVELQPVGTNSANIVWAWSAWDHLVQDFDSTKANYGTIAEHPELININANYNGSVDSDWVHLNSVDYNPQLDQLVISSRLMNEIWIIDHSASITQTATHTGGNCGKGGDLLYRWGNPRVYNRGTVAGQKFFGQHSAHWIKPGLKGAGEIMVFNNGKDRTGGDYSSVETIKTLVDSAGNYPLGSMLSFLPDTASWIYHDPGYSGFYSNNVSGAQRLPNGNTLVCSGTSGLFFEVDTTNTIVWRYKNPVTLLGPATQGSTINNNNVFRAVFYEESYPGFVGHTLVPGTPIELDPVPYSCSVTLNTNESISNENKPLVYPIPSVNELYIRLSNASAATYSIATIAGKFVITGEMRSAEEKINTSALAAGMYILHVSASDKNYFYRIVIGN